MGAGTARPQTRQEIDWRALHDQGLRVQLGQGLPRGSLFVAPFDGGHDVVVVLVPTPKAMTARVKHLLLRGAEFVRGSQWLLGLLRGA